MKARAVRKAAGITVSQIALVHVAKRELNLDEEDYRSMLRYNGGVESANKLTPEGFKWVMKAFERMGFRSTNYQPQFAPGRDAAGLPYPAQLRRLDQLFLKLNFKEPERQQGFCRRVIKKPWPQTREEANKVFEGLKAMAARGYKRKERTDSHGNDQGGQGAVSGGSSD